MKAIAVSLLFGLLAPWPVAAELTGRVVAVSDGDSLTVLVNERDRVSVRLAGIDAPERQQSFGRQSQNYLATLAFGKDVRLEGERKDGRGHLLAKVWVAEPNCRPPACAPALDAGLAQIAAGLAWHDRAYQKEQAAEDRERYAQAEFLAKVRRLGLWSESNPLPPWAWRRQRLDE